MKNAVVLRLPGPCILGLPARFVGIQHNIPIPPLYSKQRRDLSEKCNIFLIRKKLRKHELCAYSLKGDPCTTHLCTEHQPCIVYFRIACTKLHSLVGSHTCGILNPTFAASGLFHSNLPPVVVSQYGINMTPSGGGLLGVQNWPSSVRMHSKLGPPHVHIAEIYKFPNLCWAVTE